jgi:peptidoglycan/LPS O-acetylase OafA/YrhL
LGQLPKYFLTGTHLWFLYYLLLITATVLVIRALVRLIPGFYAFAINWADRLVAWVANSRFSWLALCIPTAACLWYMNSWGMDTPDKSLVPQLPVLLVYCGFFSFGWLLHRQKELIERFSRITRGGVALSIVSVGVTLVLSPYQADTGHPELGLIRAGFSLSYAIMMWSLVALSIGLFKRFFDKPSKFVQYIADASYWLYLIHLPIVVWLQIAFAELPFHWSLKLMMVSLLTIGISLALYDLFVRSTLIGKTLNGRTKERVLFRRGLKEQGQVKGAF